MAAIATSQRQPEKQERSSIHLSSVKRLRLDDNDLSDGEDDTDDVFQPAVNKPTKVKPMSEKNNDDDDDDDDDDAIKEETTGLYPSSTPSKQPLHEIDLKLPTATTNNQVFLPSYGQSMSGFGFPSSTYPNLPPFNYSNHLMPNVQSNQSYSSVSNGVATGSSSSDPSAPSTESYSNVDPQSRSALGIPLLQSRHQQQQQQQMFNCLPPFCSNLGFNSASSSNANNDNNNNPGDNASSDSNNNNTTLNGASTESNLMANKSTVSGIIPSSFTQFPFQNFAFVSQTGGFPNQGGIPALAATPFLLQKMPVSSSINDVTSLSYSSANGYMYAPYPYATRQSLGPSSIGNTTQIYLPSNAMQPAASYMNPNDHQDGNIGYTHGVRQDSISSPTSHGSESIPTTPVPATPTDLTGQMMGGGFAQQQSRYQSVPSNSFPPGLESRLQAAANLEASPLLYNFDRKSINCNQQPPSYHVQQQHHTTSIKPRRSHSTSGCSTSKRKSTKSRRATVSSIPTEPEQSVERVLIWSLDETAVILHSLLNSTYASKFGKDPSSTMSIGLRAERLIYYLAETHFFLNDLEGCDQEQLDDAMPEDSGQDLSDYKFESDGFLQSKTNSSASLSAGITSRRGGSDWLRKMAFRYRKIRDVYSSSNDNIEQLLDAKYETWMQLRREIDIITDSWLEVSRRCLSMINRRANCLSVVVTSSPLVLAYSKLVFFGLASVIPPQNVFSTSKTGTLACFDKIQSRFGRKCTYVVVGAPGRDEEIASKQLEFPFWPISTHNDLINLSHALKLGHL